MLSAQPKEYRVTKKDRVQQDSKSVEPQIANDVAPDATKKKFSLRAAFKYAFSRKGAKEVKELFLETAKDIMTSRKEALFALVMIVAMPGGQPIYLAHRIRKHVLLKKAANDNKPPAPARTSKPPAPKL